MIPLKLYNTLTRSLEPLAPLKPPAVTIYVCGPTVYDVPHIGHARSAFIFDILRRYLAFRNYQATFVRNVTDVDDKIIERARQEPGSGDLNAKCRAVTERYLKAYHETMDRLGIQRPDQEPRATEHVVPEMTDLISKLLMQGAAYEAKGDVYFAVRKFEGYGRLSNRSLDELQSGARVEPGEGKQDPLDFALWKAAKPEEPSWSSPWGRGRPGWHIDWSAMSTKFPGDAFDIHGGGVDLVFPHHENEVAQAQAAGKPFARMWIHNGLLTVKGEKMSKSLGNFVTVEQALLEARDNPDALKVFFLGAHYRSPIDYSPEAIKAALKRYTNLTSSLHLGRLSDKDATVEVLSRVEEIEKLRSDFVEAMDNDLNTPQALAVLDQLANYTKRWLVDIATNKPGESVSVLRGKMRVAYHTLLELGRGVLGLSFNLSEIGQDVERMFADYKKARARKDFEVSDQMRKKLLDQGYKIQDLVHDSVLIPAS